MMRIKIDIKEGDKFGKLTIEKIWIKSLLNSPRREIICECSCQCGKFTNTYLHYLKTKHKKSCGCLESPNNKNHPSWNGYKEITGTFWHNIEFNSIRDNKIIPFEITIEQVWDLFEKQNRKCALSGIEIGFAPTAKNKKSTTASLDRIDSNKGYVIDNIQWVHKIVNIMKMNLPQDIFILWCKKINKNNLGVK